MLLSMILMLSAATATAAPPVPVAAPVPVPLSVAPGQPALVFDLPVLDGGKGDSVSLSDFVGVLPASPQQAVVLYFFDRHHGGDSLESLSRVHRRFASRDVQVLAIFGQSEAHTHTRAWLAELRLGFPVLHDTHQVVSGRYGISGLPITLVVDGAGRVFAIGQPSSANLEPELASELEGLLRESRPSPQ